jgi:tyrosyl-tRNA synthetase
MNGFDILASGVAQIVPREEFIKKLAQNRPLRIKLGADPTSPNLHLGHAVVLKKMRQFQDLGHEVIFLIGDFTARIGDPTGRSKTRIPLDEHTILHNTRTYLEQVSRILDPKKLIIRSNSEWLDTMSAKEWLTLCAKTTLARITEREDFANRIAEQQSIGFHELLYPLLQGYDSVALKADVELGGTDQTFNLLMGRFLQEHYGQEAQVVITMPLLEGLDGIQKMSKSLNNAIGITEPAADAYGKIMSISDDLMWRWYALLGNKSDADIGLMQKRVAEKSLHPMDLKKELAHSIIAEFWSPSEANDAQRQFEDLFQKKDFSQAHPITLPPQTATPISIVELLRILEAVPTNSQARRLIAAGAVDIEGVRITDQHALIPWHDGMIVRVGKHRFYKLLSSPKPLL